ncbi:hypothetical protein C8A05DRAFT_37455 [Staphylotrichum tortipilum]|uniref:RRM domain-containing protein n=1 Tax=Staphylotrichum tortipilum TaxID=2831512 RepID=A0AAN6RQY9_9PEZI|nr:hypothetical protein C8A05DRAFT_37455 [Staphylotrichum longicolle]
MSLNEFPGVPLPAPSRTSWAWGISDNRKRIPKPDMGFYWGMPLQAICLFSAPKPERSFRPLDPKPRRCFAWDDSQVHTMVGILRERQQNLQACPLIRPNIWEDLYYYFDTVDMWRMGAWNLWRVLHCMCDEAEGIVVSPPLGHLERDLIEEWAYNWCTHEKNRDSLRRWDETSDVLSVMSPCDIENVRWCERQALDFLRGVLKHWYGMYKAPEPVATHAAEDDIAQVSSQFALAEGRPRRRSNSLPPAPSNDAKGTAGFAYTANQAVVIVNGTMAAPPKPRGTTEGQRGLADDVAGGATRKGHHPSKSGPLPAVAAGSSVATRGAGVEGSGPSRLPKAALRPAEPARPADAANTAGRSGGCCRNWRRFGLHKLATFPPCSCQRCTVASRSVFVANIRPADNVGSEQMRVIMADLFARWGHVQGCELKISNPPRHGGRAPHFAFIRFDSEASAIKTVAEVGDQPLDAPHLVGARVSHPYGSRHYNPVPQTHPGSSGSQQPAGIQGQSSPRGGAQKEKVLSDGAPGPSNRQAPAGQQQQQQPQQSQQQPTTTHRSPDDARNISGSTSGNAVPPPDSTQQAPKPGSAGVPLPSGQYQLPPRPPSASTQTRQHSGNEASKQTSPPTGIETTLPAKPPVTNEAPTQINPAPKNKLSIQTKRPSDEAVFEDSGLPPTRPSTAHSTASSMNIRIRLPSVFANPDGEGSATAPSGSKVGKEGSPPESPRVDLPSRDKIPDNSPVRRITFGDFGRPDAMPSVLQRTQPPSPTPQPRAQSTVPTQSLMLVNVSERELSQESGRAQSDRNPGDIRLEEDYNSGTVIRRRPRGNAGRLPWNEQHETGGYTPQGFRRGYTPAPPRHGPSGTFYPPTLDARPSFTGPPHHLNDTPTRSFNGPPHQPFHGPQQSFNGPPHHGLHQSSHAQPHQSSHEPPFRSFLDPPPSAYGNPPPPFHSQYPHYPSPFHGPVPNLPPRPFQSGVHGPSPPQGFHNQLHDPHRQPPPPFPQPPQPPLPSPLAAGISAVPQPLSSDHTDWYKSSKSHKKKVARAKTQARYALALQAQPRGPSPLPPASSAAASEAGTDQASVTTSTRGKGKGKWKGKGKAKARPVTPAGSEFVGEDDVHNATPRKAGDTSRTGMAEGYGGGDEGGKGGEGSGAAQAQGSGANTQGDPHAHLPGRDNGAQDKDNTTSKKKGSSDNKSAQDKDDTTTKKKGGKKKKAAPLPTGDASNEPAVAGPSNKPAQDSSNKPKEDSNNPPQYPASSTKPAAEPASEQPPAPAAEGSTSASTLGYRANAGGSLHIQRHRRFGSKPPKRGDVRDLFGDVKEE